jgi:flagellar hook-length control protein FliK
MAMSQTNIDYLFQVVGPPAERGTNAPRAGNDTNGFDDHLNQASASVFDVMRSPEAPRGSEFKPSSNRNEPARTDSTSKDSQNRRTNSSENRPENSSDTNLPSDSAYAAPPTHDLKNERDEEGDDRDSAGTEEAAVAAAGAGQPATKVTTTNSAQDGGNPEQDAITAAKEQEKADIAERIKMGGDTAESTKRRATSLVVEQTADAPTIGETAEDDTASSEPLAENAEVKDKKSDKTKSNQHADAVTQNLAESNSNASKTITAKVTAKATLAANSQDKAELNAGAGKAKPSAKDESDDEGASEVKAASPGAQAPPNPKHDPMAMASNVVASSTEPAIGEQASKETADVSTKPIAAKHETSVGPLGRAMRSMTEAVRTHSSNEEQMPQVDPARFVGRVARAFQTASERDGTLQLRLSPPELGSLKLQLTVKDGVMSAQLETENAGARRVLLEHLPALRERLAEQNIRVDRFDVDVRQENSSGQANSRGSNQNPYQPQPEQTERRSGGTQRRAPEVAAPEPVVISQRISSTGINLVI